MYRTKSEQKAPQNHHTVSFGFIVYLHDILSSLPVTLNYH